MNGLFVTGSDTNVGKTFFSTLLMLHAQKRYRDPRYLKPVQTGSDHDASTIHHFTKGQARHIYSLKQPLSPHLAAYKENKRIEFTKLVLETKSLMMGDYHIVEGAGGILVPLNERYLMIDLMSALSLPTVLVTRTSLGTINHTLMSLSALKARGLPVKAIVMMGHKNEENRQAIKHFSRTHNVFHVPFITEVNQASLDALSSECAKILDAIIT